MSSFVNVKQVQAVFANKDPEWDHETNIAVLLEKNYKTKSTTAQVPH